LARVSISRGIARLEGEERDSALRQIEGERAMQYAFLIYRDEAGFEAERSNAAAMQLLGARHMAFGREMGAARVAGAGLKGVALATTVRTSSKGVQTVHDGPFADAKEQLGGFYVIDAPDLDAAIGIAKKIPLLTDGAVEIRPVLGG
jgi:hypothetical protein